MAWYQLAEGYAPSTSGPSADEVKAIRRAYPESLFWIAADPGKGDRLTGYDLAEAIKTWLRNNNAEDKSVCEVLKERGWDGVGEADVFLSHVQAEHPRESLGAMANIDERRGAARRGTKHMGSKIWVDYFCLRQATKAGDFKPDQVVELIRKTGSVYVLMDGEETLSSYPTRTWCVFELSSTVETKAALVIQTPSSGPLRPPDCPCTCCTYSCCDSNCKPMPDYTIDAAAAMARRADDKAKVDRYIEEGPGFARVNQVMDRELRRTAVKESLGLPVVCCCFPCLYMGWCFDECCPRCNPCGWALEDLQALRRVHEFRRECPPLVYGACYLCMAVC